MPGNRTPWLSKDGKTVNPVWFRFLSDLNERTGGGAVDKVELSAGAAVGAQASADAAEASAIAAQAAADSVETRLDFDFGFDLR